MNDAALQMQRNLPTLRQQQVMQLLGDGLKLSEVAERLKYSPRTIKNDLTRLRDKYNCTNTAHLLVVAYRAGHIS